MPAGGAPTVWTVGHSTRTLEEFLALLAREELARLVDVRTFPGSRRHPQFNREALALSLAERGIEYRHAPALGGRRTPRADSPNTHWRNAGFRGYADHMATAEFRGGLATLLDDAERARTVIMCAEAVPWRCHRNMISDALVAAGARVVHVLDAGTQDHALAPSARIVDGEVRYGDAGHVADPQADLFDT